MTGVTRGRAPRERESRFVVVRECGRLDAVSPGIAVRGRPRYAPPATLWAVAYHAELRPTLRQSLAAAVLPHRRLLGRERLLQGRTAAECEREGHLEGELSGQAATLAAARALGLPTGLTGSGARVLAVDPAGAAAGRLHVGDVVVGAGTAPVRTAADLAEALAGGAGSLTVRPGQRGAGDGAPVLVGLRPGAALGARVATHRPVVDLPLDVDLPIAGDGAGPSAGLVFALALVDVLTPGSLTGGRHVAATGALDVDGDVQTVGGVGLKARAAARAGMELLLVPAGQEEEALSGARGRVPVVGVRSVADAVAALVARGGTAPLPAAPRVVDLRGPRDVVPDRAPGALVERVHQ